MAKKERSVQDCLGAALQTLAAIEQRTDSASDARGMPSLLKQVRQMVADLESGFDKLQGAWAEHAELRRQAETASRRASLLFEVSPVACLVVHGDGRIVEANTAAARVLNTSPRHLQGKPFDLFLGGDRTAFLAWLHRVAQGEQSWRRAATLRPREQRPKAIEVVASAEAAGDVALVLVTSEAPAVELDLAGSGATV